MRKVRVGKGKQLAQGYKLIDSKLVPSDIEIHSLSPHQEGKSTDSSKRKDDCLKMSCLLPFSLFFHPRSLEAERFRKLILNLRKVLETYSKVSLRAGIYSVYWGEENPKAIVLGLLGKS